MKENQHASCIKQQQQQQHQQQKQQQQQQQKQQQQQQQQQLQLIHEATLIKASEGISSITALACSPTTSRICVATNDRTLRFLGINSGGPPKGPSGGPTGATLGGPPGGPTGGPPGGSLGGPPGGPPEGPPEVEEAFMTRAAEKGALKHLVTGTAASCMH